ncbi:co-regulatory protein PtrA N-terminal domain-containing protein [Pseudomonas aeruginosa]|nr:co-regulatory protein PtrA N-terminal domain-containing protein [Pseudomonas aeruginosa]
MAWAEGGSDRVFERIQQMRDKAEAVLIQAEKAPVGERHVHMKEHMNMLEDIMRPAAQRTSRAKHVCRRHLAWMEKHDKLVDDVLGQMIREHKLMMADKECHRKDFPHLTGLFVIAPSA